MNYKLKINFLLIIFIFTMLINIQYLYADGFIIVDYPPIISQKFIEPPKPPSIKYHKVKIEINEQNAKTIVDQVFINEENQDLEGTYVFPLPLNSMVSNFSMLVDGKRMDAELLDKNKAREIYEEIIRKKKDPALLEYMDSNIFKMRIYPIPAHGEKQIQLEYNELLLKDNDIIRYQYPLNTEKFSTKPIQTVAIEAVIKSKNSIKNVYSPSHKIDIKYVSKNEVKISFEEANTKPDKDFTLYYTTSDEDFGINLLTYKPTQKEDGYFLLLLSSKFEETKSLPKDICFVVDTSGSMSGEKIKQVKNSLKFCINNLDSNDMFNIITFSTEAKYFNQEMLNANEKNIREALNYIDEIRTIGGTNINEALSLALKLKYRNNVPNFIVFLTDGIPTVGVTDINEILKNIKKENTIKAKIFCLGVGTELNTTLLDKLSLENNGITEYLTLNEDIEIKISNFYTKISSPILTDVKINFKNININQMYPKEIPDIFKGSQLVIVGRYSEGNKSIITLSGKMLDKEKEYITNVNFETNTNENSFIARLWAQRRIAFLLSEIKLHGENQELKEEIIELSKKYGILTPYTSFLILEDNINLSETNNQIYKRNKDFENKILTRLNSIKNNFLNSEYEALDSIRNLGVLNNQKSLNVESGHDAVHISKVLTNIKKSEHIIDFSKIDPELIKYIEDKTFIKRNNEWQISTYNPKIHNEKIIKIKFGSKLYFTLLNKYPHIKRYYALGKNVIFELNNKYVKISENEGLEDESKINLF